jgi:hypothetical protein
VILVAKRPKYGFRAIFPAVLLLMSALVVMPPAASADQWTKIDLGTPEGASNPHLSGLGIGDGDRDNVTELYVSSYYDGHVYQYRFEDDEWASHDLGPLGQGDSLRAECVAVGDGDDDAQPEVYASGMVYNISGSSDFAVYQFVKGGNGWNSTKIGGFGFHASSLAIGDGNNDGRSEIFASDEDGGVYQTSKGNEWSTQCIGYAPLQHIIHGDYWIEPAMEGVAVGDGDNDGQNEVYAACTDNHIYRFNYTASGWKRQDLGGQNLDPQSTSMNGLALGDLDNDGGNELYGLSTWNGTMWQYRWDAGPAAWEMNPILNISGTYVGWVTRYYIVHNPFEGRNELYAGFYDKQVYQIYLNNTTGEWDCSSIGSGGDTIMGVAAGMVSGDAGVLEVFAASFDGHLYEFHQDFVPPANPIVWSDTHPVPGTWYNQSVVHMLWKDGGFDISGIDGYSLSWDKDPATVPDDVKDCEQNVHEWSANLTDGDGWYFHIRARDNCLNWNLSATHFGPVKIDTARPDSAQLAINGGALVTQSPLVNLSLVATDVLPGSGIDKMAFSNNGVNWSGWEDFSAIRAGWDLSDARSGGNDSDGPRTVYAKVRDAAGNELRPDKVARATILLDRGAPFGLSIAINGGADFTNLPDVMLTLDATDPVSNVTRMSFSNDGGNWSEWGDWAQSRGWCLIVGAGGTESDGEKTVYFRARDLAGNIGGPVNASIFLDQEAPRNLSVAIDNGSAYTNSSLVDLSISAEDPGPASGLFGLALANAPGTPGANENFTTSKTGWSLTEGAGGTDSDGPKTVYLSVSDRAGNVGGPVNASIFLDRRAPGNLSVSVNGGSAVTNRTNVTLALSGADPEPGSGLDAMQFSDDGLNWSAWEPFASDRNLSISGPDGLKRVHFRVRDRAGNIGEPVCATIILDTAAHDITPPVISGVRVTDITNNSATVSWTTDEPADSLLEYGPDASLGLNLSSGQFVQNHTVRLTGLSPKTTYHFRVRSKDPTGNLAPLGTEGSFTTAKNPVSTVPPPKVYTVTTDNGPWLAAVILVIIAIVAAIVVTRIYWNKQNP